MVSSHSSGSFLHVPVGRTTLGALVGATGAATLSAVLFAYIAFQVAGEYALERDGGLLLGINATATPPLDYVIVGLTSLGDMLAVGALAAALLTLLALRRRWWDFWYAVLSIGSGALLNVGLKLLFARERPQLWDQLILESSYSFPSGHAMMTTVLVLVVVLLSWKGRYRWYVLFLGLMYVGVIGFSRLYLGVHYPTDVLAGWCAGVFVTAIVFILVRTVRMPYLLK